MFIKRSNINLHIERTYKLAYTSNLRIIVLFFLVIAKGFHAKGAVQDSLHQEDNRTIAKHKKYTHAIGIEFRPAVVIPSAPFFKTENSADLTYKTARSGHLKYSFALPSGTLGSQIFSNTQQGLGLGYFDFGNRAHLGTPIAAYLFQNSEITRFTDRLSLDYEWNFGLSTGWKPYDAATNPQNAVIGSRVNAYINFGLYLRWKLNPKLAWTAGMDFTHFSNGNTEYPNAGFNTSGVKLGFLYQLSPQTFERKEEASSANLPKFRKHISYDVVAFGSWRRKGVNFAGEQVASPYKYPVLGFYFAPMYNLGYRIRTGFSIDAIYDGSANVYTQDYIIGTQQQFFKPEWDHQVAVGLSARAEYMMPIFTIGTGFGTNIWHKGGDFRGTYQTFALKIRASKSSFIHIGYNLKDFHEPNYLMLGLGYSFNNKTPSLLSH